MDDPIAIMAWLIVLFVAIVLVAVVIMSICEMWRG